ncbi:ATP phosphoribosyltransferase [Gabonibacter chumensis]|uniref:ATP phosphoribosyltransferase n=1 Tax=Gabonibacter chumensis TaxID=2972474 RepID=UPI002572D057|nr:ATP phosphoribosyltransferase [Gabonibacter chumensis]MCR9012881.1 ATP phosphoribosyltransferase [Gabonibacter chumensis]
MTRLKIAVQKSGRLYDDSLALLRECGISINNGKDQLMAQASNFSLEILYLRNSDIPHYVEDGIVDLAIIGENTLIEKQSRVTKLLDLGFSSCRVSIAIPKSETFTGLSFLEGKRIATSYPNTLNAFLKQNGLRSEIHVISGSVEIAPNIGLADAICDIVSSGSTLFKNGLSEVYTLFRSTAVLVSNPSPDLKKKMLTKQLVFRMKAVLAAKSNKYILLNAPEAHLDEICRILPGMKSPTVMPLRRSGWYSLHSVVNENQFWDSIDRLKEAGAEGILVVPIEKMVE